MGYVCTAWSLSYHAEYNSSFSSLLSYIHRPYLISAFLCDLWGLVLYASSLHSKNRLVETTNTLVDMCLTKHLVKITNPSLVNYKCLTNNIG